MNRHFEIGQRVKIVGHWEFADGITGTVSRPPDAIVGLAARGEWQGHVGSSRGRKGMIAVYYVSFDQPADDGSGDGPYSGAVIEAVCLGGIKGDGSHSFLP